MSWVGDIMLTGPGSVPDSLGSRNTLAVTDSSTPVQLVATAGSISESANAIQQSANFDPHHVKLDLRHVTDKTLISAGTDTASRHTRPFEVDREGDTSSVSTASMSAVTGVEEASWMQSVQSLLVTEFGAPAAADEINAPFLADGSSPGGMCLLVIMFLVSQYCRRRLELDFFCGIRFTFCGNQASVGGW